jgi:DNA polymerase, archaea type
MNEIDINKALGELTGSQYSNIVAVEAGNNGTAELFIRNNDTITKKIVSFRPFLLLSAHELLSTLGETVKITELNGSNPFAYLAEFMDLDTYYDAVKYLKKVTGLSPSSFNAPYRLFTDIQQQILISLKTRLFRDMKFSDLRRFQFDLETLTTEGYDFPNPKREDDKIIIISMSDSTGWEKCLVVDGNTTEKDIIEEFVITVKERDPDVIEGHNLFRFDLPFIETRAKRYKVKLTLGRNNSTPKARNSRFSVAERSTSYKRYEIFGRHIVDTYFLAQLYDVSHRNLESYGLKAIAKHFNVASEKRTYIDAGNIIKYYNENRDDLIAYALDDARETRDISAILSPSYFYQVQLQPFSYQNIVVRGNATRIDALLISAYLDSKESIPKSEQPRQISGALTDAMETGIFTNVWHCDIRSLYPSIILSENWCPSRDSKKIFPFLLEKLRTIRLQAKDCEKKAESREEKALFNSLQTSFKIMINSFYGYLAFSQGTFNDYDMAENITTKGREILTLMLNFLKDSGAKVIEMDTDGIYFQPPEGVTSVNKMEQNIQKVLPKGIEVELDSTYKKMFSYKSKNYALLTDNEEVLITGAALKSRGVEPFIRDYIKKFLHLLLNEEYEEIHNYTEEFKNKIEAHEIPLSKIAKSETLKESPDNYKIKINSGKGRRSAAYELALKSTRAYRQGDQISYYVIGVKKKLSVVDNSSLVSDAPDTRNENTLYYMGKLDDIYKKFAAFIPNTIDQDDLFALK